MDKFKENKMGTAPITSLILKMSLPSMLSMMVMALYNIVDSIFVSQISPDALTAVSIVLPAQFLLISVGSGTAIGVNSLIARSLGAKKFDTASAVASHAIVLSVISWIVFAILGFLFADIFVSGFTQSESIREMGSIYLKIVTIASIGILMQISAEKILQATGNMMLPMISQLTGAVINIALDPILIFGYFGFPEMGIAGAATATVFSQCIGMVVALVALKVKKTEVHISLRNFKFDRAVVIEIYRVGLPSMIMQSVGSFLTVGLNAILAGFSDAAVSVLGIYFRIQSFIMMPVFGMTQGLMPIMGYNFGAKNKKRLLKTLKTGTIMAMIIMCAGTLVFMFFPEQLLGMFNPTEEVLLIGTYALRAISSGFPFAAVGIIFSTLFQAVGNGKNSMYISLIRQLVFILPAAYVLSFFGVQYIWFAFPFAEIFAIFAVLYLYKAVYKKQIQPLGD